MKKEENINDDIEKIYYNKFKEIYVSSLSSDNLIKIISDSINSRDKYYKSVLSGAKKAHKEMEIIFNNINKRR